MKEINSDCKYKKRNSLTAIDLPYWRSSIVHESGLKLPLSLKKNIPILTKRNKISRQNRHTDLIVAWKAFFSIKKRLKFFKWFIEQMLTVSGNLLVFNLKQLVDFREQNFYHQTIILVF